MCRELRECLQLAAEAEERHDFETFHDLAWRAVQLGPRNDPSLMYRLARAQALSGRPHDSLIMLERLAEMGVATDAATNDDFRRTRALPDWADVEPVLARVGQAADSRVLGPGLRSSEKSATTSSPPTSGAASRAVPPRAAASNTAAVRVPDAKLSATTVSSIDQAVRVSSPRFSAAGLAYDAVSRRFVVGDLHDRKLMVVDETADHAVDLVRADSAGFRDIAAIEIDGRRGDLWVATVASEGSGWTLHRMQLLSGRPLRTVQVPADLEPLRLVDLAVSPAGALLALDAAGDRLLVLRPGGTTPAVVPHLTVHGPTSVAATSDEKIVYIAHEAGVSRIDLTTGASVLVTEPKDHDMKRIERIRWHGNALLAVQANDSQTRRIVRFKLNGSGGKVTAATTLEASIPAASGPTFATIAGDDLSYLVAAVDSAAPSPATDQRTAFTIRRIRLP
jgi:hypothetical protein